MGPEYPINVGYIARLLKNFGMHKLYLVEPKFDRRVASVYAAHGSEVVEDAEEVSLNELRKRHDLLVATTAIPATKSSNVNRLSVAPEEVREYMVSSKLASLVLGRDTTGLKNEEIAVCDLVTTIYTGTRYQTMNVSHSAAILFYIFSRKSGKGRLIPSLETREAFANCAYELALASDLQSFRAKRLRQMAKRMAIHSQLDEKELTSLLSLMRKALVKIGPAYRRSNT